MKVFIRIKLVIKMTASELKINQRAIISKLHLKLSDRRRCFNMGIYEGVSITLIKKAPFKDPYLFQSMGMKSACGSKTQKELK